MKTFKQALDAASEHLMAEQPRGHLGASQVGHECPRSAWYSFRWAYLVQHGGRMLRLFNRGHEEEFRVVKWLRGMEGVTVKDYAERLGYNEETDTYITADWDATVPPGHYEDVHQSRWHIERATARGVGPKQWSFNGEDLHADKVMRYYRGSSDGKVSGIEKWFPAAVGEGGLECKTSNDAGFKQLEKKGVLTGKPQHYKQMQCYMHGLGLPWCLYVVVNKNTDDIYTELVQYKKEVGDFYVDRAHNIITAAQPPKRITADPSWFVCKFCDYRENCHHGKPLRPSCRTCAFAAFTPEGVYCGLHRLTVPKERELNGCQNWETVDK